MSITSKKPSPDPPLPFEINDSTQLEDWKKWQRSFRHYANSINLEQQCHDIQLCIFKSLIGPDGMDIYNTFSILDITDVESVIRKFDEHFKPKVNITLERYKLYKLNQTSGQKFEDFLLDITNQADKCAFSSMRNEIVLYKIVGGIENNEVRNALLAEADLKYDKAVEICRASSAIHFMSEKENREATSTTITKKGELGKTRKVSYKENRRTLQASAKKDQEVDYEIKVNTSKVVQKQGDTKKVSDKESAVERFLKEDVVKCGTKKSKEIETLIKNGSKENVIKCESEENEKRDGHPYVIDVSDGSDSDWRADDDHDYDSDHLSPEKPNMTKAHRKNIKGSTSKKRVNKKKRDPVENPSKVKDLPCDICGETLKTELALERHRSIHVHGKHAICYYCGKKLSKTNLRKHMNGSHYEIIGCPLPKFYSCDVCDFKTRYGDNLRRHMYQHTGEKPLACELCEYRCIRPRLLKAHIAKIHTGERPFTCSICKRGFLHSDVLKSHMVTHMAPEEKAKHRGGPNATCEVCGKVLSSTGALKTHSIVHSREKPFACDKCGFRTGTNALLTSHMMIHSEEKPFVCTVCGYSCRQKGSLQQHMLTHTGEKPYACEVCSRKFTQAQHLKTHMLTHTGDRPHVCELCGYGFTTSGSLKAHMKVHLKHSGDASLYTPPPKRKKLANTADKRHVCEICGHGFTKRGSLTAHIEVHKKHSGDASNCNPPSKRQKKPPVKSVPAQSDDCGQSENECIAADAIITWSEQVSAINSVAYSPSLETPPPFHFHPTYPIHQGNPRPSDCRYYQQNQNYRQDQNQGQ